MPESPRGRLDQGHSVHDYHWPAENGHGGGVYILHGLGEHAGRYEPLARRLNALGWQVAAHDHPGHGRSAGVRGNLARSPSLRAVAAARFEQFAGALGRPPCLLGHSMGGAVAADLVLHGAVAPAGLVLSSPAFRIRLSRVQKMQLAIMNRVAPDMTVTARLSGPRLTHDDAQRRLWQDDRLITRSVSAALVRWLAAVGDGCLDVAAGLGTPTLLLVAGDDAIVDPEASAAFAARAPAGSVTLHCYDGLYHEIFNESPDDRERVFKDLFRWLAHFDLSAKVT